ncbi:MAG: hypothetical protein AMJ79_07165 [Phycisphaerae bacterium SM23_30]|nr:MAG: hypothetical protein AMJ79_07165 [Phycisphaerae bacterium SM23_30]
MNDHTKKERRQILKKLITEKQMSDQIQLLEELKKHHIAITQATISRDLQEMGVVKIRIKPGVFKYELLTELPPDQLRQKLQVLFDNFVTEIKSVDNLLLVKTTPGNANGVASFIDRLGQKEILGTVAGDDTILIIADSPQNRKTVEKDFTALLQAAQ